MDPEQRRQLAALARKKGKRRVPKVHRFKPWTVTNPEDNQPFTEAAAWEFIAQRLEDAGQCVEEKVLDKPPGKLGFVIEYTVADRAIYIKFYTDQNRSILGLSFHYSGEG